MNDMFGHPPPPQPQDAVPARAQAGTAPSVSTSHSTNGNANPSVRPAPPSPPIVSQPAEAGPQQPTEQPSSNSGRLPVTQPVQQPAAQSESSQASSQPGMTSNAQPAEMPVAQLGPRPNPQYGVQVDQVAGNTPDTHSNPHSSAPLASKLTTHAGGQQASQSDPRADTQADRRPTRQCEPKDDTHPVAKSAAKRNLSVHPASANGPPKPSASHNLIADWSSLSPDQKQAYYRDTNTARSRKKPRPSLDRHRDFISDCVKGKANLRQVFYDLCALDPGLTEDFGEKGHRRFGDAVKDMSSK